MLSHSGINLSSSIFQKNADTLSAFSMLLRVTLAVSPATKSLLTILIPVNTPFLYPATINDVKYNDVNGVVTEDMITDEGMIIKKGKKTFHRVVTQ